MRISIDLLLPANAVHTLAIAEKRLQQYSCRPKMDKPVNTVIFGEAPPRAMTACPDGLALARGADLPRPPRPVYKGELVLVAFTTSFCVSFHHRSLPPPSLLRRYSPTRRGPLHSVSPRPPVVQSQKCLTRFYEPRRHHFLSTVRLDHPCSCATISIVLRILARHRAPLRISPQPTHGRVHQRRSNERRRGHG